MRLISQLTKGMPRVFQKLLEYFNGTIISTFLGRRLAVLSIIFLLKLNQSTVIITPSLSTPVESTLGISPVKICSVKSQSREKRLDFLLSRHFA